MMKLLTALCLGLVATSANAFEGTYSGGEGSQSLVIRKNSGNRYTLSMEVAIPGCQGDMIAKGRAKGKTLTAVHKSDGINCALTVKKTKRGVTLDEGTCFVMHGASCQFSGDYTLE